MKSPRRFVASALPIAVVFAFACVSSNEGGSADAGTGVASNPAACPFSEPTSGTPCSESDLSCGYAASSCVIHYQCRDSTWAAQFGSCTAAPPPCTKAASGDPCGFLGQSCVVEPACQTCTKICDSMHVWAIDCTEPACNQPGCPTERPDNGGACTPGQACAYPVTTPCGPETYSVLCLGDEFGSWMGADPSCVRDCGHYVDIAECSLDAGCRWLEPDCAGSTFPFARCVDAEDCTTNLDCGGAEICVEVTVKSCLNGECGACASRHACVEWGGG